MVVGGRLVGCRMWWLLLWFMNFLLEPGMGGKGAERLWGGMVGVLEDKRLRWRRKGGESDVWKE